MTTPGRSPPRSKKGSSAASEFLTAGSIVADLESDDEPETVAFGTPEASASQDAQPVEGVVEEIADAPAPEAPAAEPEPSRRELKAARRQERQEAKAAARRERDEAAQAKLDAKQQERQQREDAKRQAREDRELAKQQARDEKDQAKQQAAAAREQEAADQAAAREQEAADQAAAREQEAADRRRRVSRRLPRRVSRKPSWRRQRATLPTRLPMTRQQAPRPSRPSSPSPSQWLPLRTRLG